MLFRVTNFLGRRGMNQFDHKHSQSYNLVSIIMFLKFHRFGRFSTLIDPPIKNPLRNFPTFSPIPLPHKTLPEPRGQDADFINVAHSHLLHTDWGKLEKMASGLNPFRVKHILLKCQKDYALSLEFFKWVGVKNEKLISLEATCVILHVLTKNRKFKSTEGIVRGMVETCSYDFHEKVFDAVLHSYRMCDSSPRVFDCIFKTYAHIKKFRNASNTFCRMKEYGFLPTVESCNAFLSSLISFDRAGLALAFYKEMRRSRISVNVFTLNIAICAFCKLGELDKAVEVLTEMESMSIRPTVASYNTLIAGYCSQGLLPTAVKLKSSMERRGVAPDAITYNTLIHGLCKEGKLHEAYRLFNEMKSVDVAPNTVTFNTLINGYVQAGNLSTSSQLFDEMARMGVKADILTYNALILGLCKVGKTKKAAYLVKELDKKKLVPNSSTFAALIAGQCARKDPKRAFELYKSMITSGCCPNGETLNMMMSSFLHNEDYDGAVKVLRELLERSVAPDSSILRMLVDGLRQHGKDELFTNLFKEMPKIYEMFNSIISKPHLEAQSAEDS